MRSQSCSGDFYEKSNVQESEEMYFETEKLKIHGALGYLCYYIVPLFLINYIVPL